MHKLAFVLLAAAFWLAPPTVSAQPVHLTPENQRTLIDADGALGVTFQEERIAAGDGREIAALGVSETLTTSSPLKPGDVILSVNDRTASTAGVFRSYIGSLRPGSSAVLTVIRTGHAEPQKINVAVVSRSTMRIPGIEPPPSAGTTFARSCASGAIAGIVTAGLTLLIAPIDGGFTFAAFAPKAFAGAVIGCAAVGTGSAVAQEIVPSQNVIQYRRIM